jgi:ABC-type transport system involved in multi-copper enzyme maturation permease subunit
VNISPVDAVGLLAALHGHRHGPRVFVLVVIVIVIGVGLILLWQRHRDRHPVETTLPAPRSPAGQSESSAGEGSLADTRTSLHEITPAAITVRAPLPSGRYGLLGLLRSEWTKLRSVRSTVWTLGVTVVLGIGVSALITAEIRANWPTMSIGQRLGFDPISSSLIGVFIGQFAIGILGVLVITAEYGTGTIRATFSAAPRRRRVLVAKVVVFGVVALVVAEVVSFLAFLLGQALLSAPATHATLGSPGAWRAVVGSGLYVGVLGLLGLGLGAIIRHTAGAISTFVALLLVLPLLVQALPSSIELDVRRYLPDRIGADMISSSGPPGSFSPWVGLLVLAGYAAAALAVGSVLLARRDA